MVLRTRYTSRPLLSTGAAEPDYALVRPSPTARFRVKALLASYHVCGALLTQPARRFELVREIFMRVQAARPGTRECQKFCRSEKSLGRILQD